MSDPELNTIHLHQCVQRWQDGDRAAADELLQTVGARLELLTRKMLRSFPKVRQWAETVDVLQGSLMRLLRTLEKLRPESTRHFFNLAAVHVRRELLDLARHFKGDRCVHLASPKTADDTQAPGLPEPVDRNTEDADFDLWRRFHEAVDHLPVEEREVMGLVFYHGWKQVQIAELFQVDERTIRRRWQSACLRLHEMLGQELPSP